MKWTFAGGVSILDNQTYTAVLVGVSPVLRIASTNPYPDDEVYSGSINTAIFDTVFQGNFSSTAAPFPFEFEPSGGFAILGGAWVLRKRLQKQKVTKD